MRHSFMFFMLFSCSDTKTCYVFSKFTYNESIMSAMRNLSCSSRSHDSNTWRLWVCVLNNSYFWFSFRKFLLSWLLSLKMPESWYTNLVQITISPMTNWYKVIETPLLQSATRLWYGQPQSPLWECLSLEYIWNHMLDIGHPLPLIVLAFSPCRFLLRVFPTQVITCMRNLVLLCFLCIHPKPHFVDQNKAPNTEKQL